ncbi:CBM35 domain-containing protein [Arthrobacter sp. 24S4-2]|uniref:fibronectin type III domain-containing protein n=1 Tax=Arthrobacter sp. 24S4-2 TaxID=2575374 RepID=UPI001C2F571F|nr:CBM35 domain-containing protein [Arthrobacter sp. 24S4-2]
MGPGSFKGGPNYDNTADIQAWHKAIDKSGRPMQYVVSWALSHKQADVWKANTNGWRIDTDVECYCNTLVTWDQSVKQRWNDVVQWIDDAGPGHWNNLDAVNVGVGSMDGLTEAERQSYMTLWTIESAPLFAGDDLTKLDDYGLSLLTNRDAIAINQAGHPARPVSQSTGQQVWYANNDDGSVTVALFNLDNQPASVTANFTDLGLGGTAEVRDVWLKKDTGVRQNSINADLPAHGSKLFTITPTDNAPDKPAVPTGVRATQAQANSVSLAWYPSPVSADSKNVNYRVFMDGREVGNTNATTMTVGQLNPSSRHTFTVRADSGPQKSAQSSVLDLTLPSAAGPTLYEAEAAGNTLSGGASRSGCAGCSAGGKAGNLGGSGSLTFAGVNVPVAGNYLMTVAYVDGDASRQSLITINGKPTQMNFQGSNDNNWDAAQQQQILVHLDAGVNTIQVGSPDSYSADIDAITI